jgi:thiamine biosynthesis lipoprotein
MMESSAFFFSELVRRTSLYASALRKERLESSDHLKANSFCAILLSLLLFTSCQKQEPESVIKELQGEVFGSYYIVKYRGGLEISALTTELNSFFNGFNQEFSTYQNDSVISEFNRHDVNKKLKVSTRFIEMLKLAKQFYEETEGAFDPTLGPVIRAWGFGGGKKRLSDAQIKEAYKKVGFKKIQWDESTNEVWKTSPVEIDVNAFAPGWAADLMGEILLKKGIENFMVDISGEILFRGDKGLGKPWIGGIEKPAKEHAKAVHLALKMKNVSIATSGNYRQYFDDNGVKKSHIIDPRTGNPVTHNISSASVITDTAARADAWGTAMMVLGTQGLAISEKNDIKVLLLEAVGPNEFTEIVSPSMSRFIEAHKL